MYTITRRRERRQWPLGLLVYVVVVGGYVTWALLRPLPLLRPAALASPLVAAASQSTLSWPAAGASAVGIVGSDILETHGSQAIVPTASTAKIITVLTVLQHKPLRLDESGPAITLSNSDVALYNTYAAQQGSVVKVVAGEQISEYQMLQTIMLPSANNMADSLALWAFGSLSAYNAAASAYLAEHNLSGTHVGSDASGLSPTTTSTAHDLVKLGELAMQDPVLAQIVGQPTATGIPVVKNIKNVNFLLGSANIIGVKTGNTDQAGGVFVSASRTSINNKPVTIVTAYANAPTLFAAVNGSLPFIQSAQANFKSATIVKAGSVVGRYSLPWGGTVPVIAVKSLTIMAWNGSPTAADVHLPAISPATQPGQITGEITTKASALADQKTIPLSLATAPAKPTIWWRLTHPLPQKSD